MEFVFNNLAYFIMLIVVLVSGCSLMAARATMLDKRERFNFYCLMFMALIGLGGIIFTADIFTLYLFIEVTALASFVMITQGRNARAYEGTFKYLLLSVIASVFMLTGVALTLLFAHGTSFIEIRSAALAGNANFLPTAALAFFVAGLFIKGGVVPFHGWVPDAYSSAPKAVSVFLAGIVTKVSGIYVLMRLLTLVLPATPKLNLIFLVFGTLSIFVGALAAIGQKEIRRMLAYSSISQVGYIVLALGVGTQVGIVAAVFHFFNHAVMKSQLFLNAAALEEATGTGDMDKMGGLMQKMPVTGITSIIASLSVAGIPPLSGFWSKLLIVMALWLSGQYVFAFLAVLASLITLGYFLMFQRKVFFMAPTENIDRVKEVGFELLFPTLLLCALTVIIGVGFFLWYY
ncbi:MAG: proton-conducting transporter membrane subunit [Candidatus Margulisiibacteriota bacterium]